MTSTFSLSLLCGRKCSHRPGACCGKGDLLILDKFGYIPLDSDEGRLLFQVKPNRYKRQSMALTTNIEFGKWGTVLADDELASTLVDGIAFATPTLKPEGFGICRHLDTMDLRIATNVPYGESVLEFLLSAAFGILGECRGQ